MKWPASAGNSSFVKGFFFEKQTSCYSFKVCSAMCVCRLTSLFWKASGSVSDGLWGEVLVTDRGSEPKLTCWMKSPSHFWLPGSASRLGAKTQPFDSKLWLTGPQTMQANEIWLEIRWNLPSYIHFSFIQSDQGINICIIVGWMVTLA